MKTQPLGCMTTKGLLVNGHDKQVKFMNVHDSYVNSTDKPTEQQAKRFPSLPEIQQDSFEDEFFENINSTPLGRLLKLIATIPEIRRQKVAQLRSQINDGHYDINHNLDEALDRVLEELITES
jgi:anti-sigma28 factor (negative regulator of flagellin synthesis)